MAAAGRNGILRNKSDSWSQLEKASIAVQISTQSIPFFVLFRQFRTQSGFTAKQGQTRRYGDKVYFENVHFRGQHLSRDKRRFVSEWITSAKDGDWWVIEPAVTR